jgi:glycosyltransferase involved in cell wall biosynthesis
MSRFDDIFIIQRVVPHYRVALFKMLYELYGVRVICASNPPTGSFLQLANPEEFEFAIPMQFDFKNPNSQYPVAVPVKRILSEFSPRAIVAEFALRMSSSYSLPLARRIGTLRNLAFWTHGWQVEQHPSGYQNLATNAARIAIMSTADVIATYSQQGRLWAERHVPFARSIALGNALDVRAIRDIAEAVPALNAGFPQLLAIGRLTPDKSISSVARAFLLVKEKLPNAALTIIGDGPDRSRLEAEMAAGAKDIAGSIKFTGSIHDEHMLAPHFKGADLLVLPGSAGLAVNHALAYNLPIVGFRGGGGGPDHHPEVEYIVEGVSGSLVSPATPEALAQRILYVIESGDYLIMRQKIITENPAPDIDKVADNFGLLFNLLSR